MATYNIDNKKKNKIIILIATTAMIITDPNNLKSNFLTVFFIYRDKCFRLLRLFPRLSRLTQLKSPEL